MIRLIAALITRGDIPFVPQHDLTSGSTGTVSSVLQVVFGFAGAIALLIITKAGFKYVISQGEPQEIKKAKDTILYALAGLIVSILAFSIVTFVINRVK